MIHKTHLVLWPITPLFAVLLAAPRRQQLRGAAVLPADRETLHPKPAFFAASLCLFLEEESRFLVFGLFVLERLGLPMKAFVP